MMMHLSNSVLVDNEAARKGGGICLVSGLDEVVNCTIVGNAAPEDCGGGICKGVYSGQAIINNSIVYANMPLNSNISMESTYRPRISCSNIWGCGGSGSGWNSAIGVDGGGNIDYIQAIFVNASDPDGDDNKAGTSDDGLRLQKTTNPANPCIDSGDNSVKPLYIESRG